MNRPLIILTILASLAFGVVARQPQSGYRGFIDWNNDYRTIETWMPGHREGYIYTGLSTSHGYQICSEAFVGAGILLEHCPKFDNTLLAAFVHGRTDLKFGRFTPFGDIRLGYCMKEGGGIYFSPAIGYRFNWGRKMGINIGAGLTLQGYKYYTFDIVTSPEGYNTAVYTGSGRRSRPYFTFKVGVDF